MAEVADSSVLVCNKTCAYRINSRPDTKEHEERVDFCLVPLDIV